MVIDLDFLPKGSEISRIYNTNEELGSNRYWIKCQPRLEVPALICQLAQPTEPLTERDRIHGYREAGGFLRGLECATWSILANPLDAYASGIAYQDRHAGLHAA